MKQLSLRPLHAFSMILETLYSWMSGPRPSMMMDTLRAQYIYRSQSFLSVPASGSVNISVYHLTGDLVATILDHSLLSGAHTVRWNAQQHPSGVYIVRIGSSRYVRTQKVMLLK